MYKVLFVDDDETIGFIVSKMKVWENSNFKITRYAQNGKEALLVLEKESFDLIITDIRMPIVDGLELLENIRKGGIKLFLYLQVPIVNLNMLKEVFKMELLIIL